MWKNPLPGVPAVESPFLDCIAETEGWDDETWRIGCSLRDHGYAVFEFPDPDVGSAMDRIVADLGPRFDWNGWRSHGREHGEGLRIQDAWQFNDDVRAIAANPAVLALLSRLYGRTAFPFQTLNFPVGTQQSTHNDGSHFNSVPERFMCGIWLAFEPTDEANGALHYYPGSHRLPSYTNEHIDSCSATSQIPDAHYGRMTELWRELIRVHGLSKETHRARRGQALIWSANLLHGGDPHRDASRTRWSQVTHYYFDGCSYYTPLVSDPFFGSIYFRDIVDISTGEKKAQLYAGHSVSAENIRWARKNARAHAPELPKPPRNFNAADYLAANPDVAAAGTDALKHWQMFGHREQRPLAPAKTVGTAGSLAGLLRRLLRRRRPENGRDG